MCNQSPQLITVGLIYIYSYFVRNIPLCAQYHIIRAVCCRKFLLKLSDCAATHRLHFDPCIQSASDIHNSKPFLLSCKSLGIRLQNTFVTLLCTICYRIVRNNCQAKENQNNIFMVHECQIEVNNTYNNKAIVSTSLYKSMIFQRHLGLRNL